MKILTSSKTLDWAGVPTYTLTLYRELERRGHHVTVYSPKSGPMAKMMRTVTSLDPLDMPDAIVAQHNVCALSLRHAYPNTPLVYSAHGVTPEIEQAPRGIHVDWWEAINTQVRDNLIRQYVPAERIDIVRDFVDLDTYRSTRPLTTHGAPNVLFVSNYKKWKAHYRLAKACRTLGWPFKAVGSPYGRSRDMITELNAADIVVSWGRGILEAMACGRCVISYDKELGDGYLNQKLYLESRERNFCGYECRHCFTVDGLIQELRWIDPSDGQRNRNLAVTHHDAVHGTNLVLASIEKAQAVAVAA